MALASTVMDRAAALLNDSARSLYSYTVQLPYLKSAWDRLQMKLQLNGIPVVEEISSVTNVAANATYITSPSDLVMPLAISERADETSDLFVDVEYVSDIPEMDQEDTIIYWTWREEVLYINPPATNREVKIRYLKSLTAISGESTSLAVLNSTEYLAYKTAALCARYIGENPVRADYLDMEAQSALEELLAIEVKAKQAVPVRPRSYGASKKYVF